VTRRSVPQLSDAFSSRTPHADVKSFSSSQRLCNELPFPRSFFADPSLFPSLHYFTGPPRGSAGDTFASLQFPPHPTLPLIPFFFRPASSPFISAPQIRVIWEVCFLSVSRTSFNLPQSFPSFVPPFNVPPHLLQARLLK